MPSSPELPEKTDRNGLSHDGSGAGGNPCATNFDPAFEYARSLAIACEFEPSDSPLQLLSRPASRPWTAHPSLEWARSGAMALSGRPDEAPRLARGPVASAMAGAAWLLESLLPESPAPALDGPALLGERAAIFGHTRKGDQSPGGSARLLSTASGPLALNLPREDDWQMMPAWLEVDPQSIGPSDSSPRQETVRWEQLSKLLRDRERSALVDRGRLIGLAVADCPTSPPENKNFFRVQQASECLTIDGTGHRNHQSGRRLRVLDLSTLWAGPLATSLLQDAGLDILKVESPLRPDGARQGPEGFFDLMNGAKRGCALDLRDGPDRAHFERLLDAADVVVESARPRAVAQLGFDATGWVSERPGRIWASITGYGREHEWIAFGDDAAVAAGLAFSPTPGENDPCFCADAIADPLTGLHVAVVLLAALRAGRGGLYDFSLRDIAARAASAEHAGLVLPVEKQDGVFRVEYAGQFIPVAPPRARTARGRAPALAAPSVDLIEDWTGRSC